MKNKIPNSYCSDCKQLGDPCSGSFNRTFSNCVYKRTWLSNGEKVKVKASGKIGKIIRYDYLTNSYSILLEKGWAFSYKRNELEEA